jgi:hypothetical protein
MPNRTMLDKARENVSRVMRPRCSRSKDGVRAERLGATLLFNKPSAKFRSALPSQRHPLDVESLLLSSGIS